jgi:predicted acetyltransferase
MKRPAPKVTDIKPDEQDAFIKIIQDALVVPENIREREGNFMKSAAPLTYRAVRASGSSEIAGGLIMGHWNHYFGGRPVPAAPIMAVGISPEHRRQGYAFTLMAETLKELYKSGMPISVLFAANAPLYRKAGYETAIEKFKFTVNISDITTASTPCSMVRHPNEWSETLDSLFTKFMADQNGNIKRTRAMWTVRFDAPFLGSCFTYIIKTGNEATGYVVFFQNTDQEPLRVTDYAFTTPDTGMRILTAIKDHSSRLSKFIVSGGSADPLIQLLPDSKYELSKTEPCMLRIVSVPRALEEKGYPVQLKSEIHFDITDDIINENNGKIVLKLSNGRGKIISGGNGNVKIDIRSLAQLYSSLITPKQLSISGTLDASPRDLETLSLAFSGSRPWIRDGF